MTSPLIEDSHSVPRSCSNSQRAPSDNARLRMTCGGSSGGLISGAKYKFMSRAKLPICRSTCITVPPGLSPTSFLESPVLFSNIKAEPSLAAGSFFKPSFMQNSGGTAAVSLEMNFSGGNNVDEKASSSSFEFKLKTRSTSASGLSPLMIPAGLNRNIPVTQSQDQCFSPSAFVAGEQPGSHERIISTPMGIHDSPVCNTVDGLKQGVHSKSGILMSYSDCKDISTTTDKTFDDGYNWRKYGQKLVKGSEFPRSYYKCTYPNCEVKKIFECSPAGQITEIVYKGSHDHPKTQARRQNPGALMYIQDDKMDKTLSSFTGQDDEDKSNANVIEPNVSPALSPRQANEEGIEGLGSQIQVINDEIDEEDPFSKRRKMEDILDFTPVVKPIREPRVVVQTVSEVDILDDGYRWRKYGQKVVRGNPNPRSYYKCTNAGCPVRKHVERASHNPKAVITTYECKHNHNLPATTSLQSPNHVVVEFQRPG